MKKFMLITLIVSVFSCKDNSKGSPFELMSLDFNVKNSKSMLVSPSQTKECDVITHKNVEFIVCYNEKSSSKIDYIFTNDTNYITSDNIKIGTSFLDVKKLISKTEVSHIPGWAYEIDLPSKWIACFDYQDKIEDSSKVKFLYYRGNGTE
ncbi:hypothetical protein [Winogradskyella sp.]|uniref:hypothetical protein n=1 Tax=Winogradskyella sp. TaxID=1883156 RepID=UPI001B0543B6|nr:hypothetical protein [Winogradskyella sp.]MBO6881920.1 hypothetical protein [Winogradskyella sp.]